METNKENTSEEQARGSSGRSLAERFREALFSEKHQTNSELAKKLGKNENTIGNLKFRLKRKCIEEIKSREDISKKEKQAEINKLNNDYFKVPSKPTLIPPEDEVAIEKLSQQTPPEVKPTAKEEFKSQLAEEAVAIELGKKHIREEEKKIEELEEKAKPFKEYLGKLNSKGELSPEELSVKKALKENIDGIGKMIELRQKALEDYKMSTAQREELYRMRVTNMIEKTKADMEILKETYEYRHRTRLLEAQENYKKALTRTNPIGEQSPPKQISPQEQMDYLLDTLLEAKKLFNPPQNPSQNSIDSLVSIITALGTAVDSLGKLEGNSLIASTTDKDVALAALKFQEDARKQDMQQQAMQRAINSIVDLWKNIAAGKGPGLPSSETPQNSGNPPSFTGQDIQFWIQKGLEYVQNMSSDQIKQLVPQVKTVLSYLEQIEAQKAPQGQRSDEVDRLLDAYKAGTIDIGTLKQEINKVEQKPQKQESSPPVSRQFPEEKREATVIMFDSTDTRFQCPFCQQTSFLPIKENIQLGACPVCETPLWFFSKAWMRKHD